MEKEKCMTTWSRISWGSVIAGVITVIAISILLSILGTSIGLFMFDPTESHPASGIGATMGIWTAVSLLISLAAGGFVAGKLSGSDGFIHGFLVWSSTLIVGIIFVVAISASAIRLTTNILGSVTSAAGHVLSGAGSLVKGGSSELADAVHSIFGEINMDDSKGIDQSQNVSQNMLTALRKSGVKEFQPEYLQNQMDGIKVDFNKSVKQLATHPNDAENILNGFLNRLQERENTFASQISRDDLEKAIANNTSLSKVEVHKAVDQYMELIDKARVQGQEKIQQLQQSIEQAKEDWLVFKQKALEQAKKAAHAAAWSGIISFFALIIGACICCYAGMFGTRKSEEGYDI
ncbi:MAG: hypothetical protein LBR52_02670 [Prevotellaceae bacterium]|jgi:hypothetical protein|nr:hypothetical protein [Prevotellaceae bacterium]